MHPGSSFTLLRCAPCVGPSCRRLFALGAPFHLWKLWLFQAAWGFVVTSYSVVSWWLNLDPYKMSPIWRRILELWTLQLCFNPLFWACTMICIPPNSCTLGRKWVLKHVFLGPDTALLSIKLGYLVRYQQHWVVFFFCQIFYKEPFLLKMLTFCQYAAKIFRLSLGLMRELKGLLNWLVTRH